MSSLCAHSLISTYKITKPKTMNFIWLTFCIQLFKYATLQTSQTFKGFFKNHPRLSFAICQTNQIFWTFTFNFSNLLHHKPPIMCFFKFQYMPLSFTKQIKYFEHLHSSFQIFHIINHLQCFFKNHSIYAFAIYQTNERFSLWNRCFVTRLVIGS